MRLGAAAIIKNYDGTFLLHLRDEKAPLLKNEWCLVGGTPEDGETPEDAIKREILEETALRIEHLSFYTSFISENTGKNISVFIATVDTHKQKVVLGEGRELRFFSKEDALKLLASIKNKNQYLQVFEKYLKSKG